MTSSTHEVPVAILDLLRLPDPETLTDDQLRGATCVWCDQRLNAELAVDLGERTEPIRWFPRGGRDCAAKQALLGLFDHTPHCEPCRNEAPGCDVGRGLNRLVAGGFRWQK